MKPTIELESASVFFGSNLEVLPTLADNSVDSIVTDPPYELGFMGKSWDSTGIAYSVELWRECLRVLKPGGHILAFGASRTWHRLAVAIEDGGFELRDSIAWLYGSGFPKSLDVSKAIDKAAGAEREIVGQVRKTPINENGLTMSGGVGKAEFDITTPATNDAKKWAGWGTALKPAFEPVVVGRKPLIGTVAANVLEWGVGGLNIDASRIGTEQILTQHTSRPAGDNLVGSGAVATGESSVHTGRWPANIILDPYTAELLDEQSGISTSLAHNRPHATKWGFGVNSDNSNDYDYATGQTGYGDTGGASRFFYVAKASKRDRNEGLDELEAKANSKFAQDKWSLENMSFGNVKPAQNFHPTVKPTELMRYLIKLVTPTGGVVLDPFTGSGSTGKAALLDGYHFLGIELTEDYLPIIEGRLQFAIKSKKAEELRANKQNEEALFTIGEE